jgi:hypothetical protein
VFALQDLPHPHLVARIGVGVQQADADRRDATFPEEVRGRHRRLFVQRANLGAGVVEPPTYRAHQVGRNDPVGLHPEVAVAVTVRHGLPGDLEHELVPLGGDEPQPVDLAFEQLVRGDRCAVTDRGYRAGFGVQHREHPGHPGDHAVGRIVRRRGNLRGDKCA